MAAYKNLILLALDITRKHASDDSVYIHKKKTPMQLNLRSVANSFGSIGWRRTKLNSNEYLPTLLWCILEFILLQMLTNF